MRVFVIGATGFVGLPAAQALVRAGHIVYGLARTPEKAKLLEKEEIHPVLGDASDPSAWISIIANIDVVIEAIGGGPDFPQLQQNVFKAVTDAAGNRPVGSAKISYIYTSGAWVHGDDRQNIITDNTPITSPVSLVAWRPAVEQAIVNSKVVNGIVVRPGIVYGRSGSLLAILFSAPTGKPQWYGTPGGRWSAIHTDDLANFYVLAAEKAGAIGGQIFDVVNDTTESVDEILAKAAKLIGASGYEYVAPTNPFEEALSTTQIIRPYLARALLGWTPRRIGLLDGLEIYYASFKAHAGK
ncbi:hypothetical protein EIP91_009304 [Steccherinum ochraceum]|uniref:NAD(P)-binding domain-containing protein n=1 Tax=Steccherinum ochraceum TaxID=92696 RepID=A0A4R0R4G1_9APHY|nr:hypothetical protein EIP91_009304 [Steccherinum ochraceum]